LTGITPRRVGEGVAAEVYPDRMRTRSVVG